MTCRHVLGLMDAGRFAAYPRRHLEAAWQHARQCATCGPALEASRALDAHLGTLPHPAPPRDLTHDILARIARVDAHVTATARTRERRAPSGTADPLPWTTAGAIATSFVLAATAASREAGLLDGTASRDEAMAAVATIPGTPAGALALVAGLVLYLVALLAPLRGGSGRGLGT